MHAVSVTVSRSLSLHRSWRVHWQLTTLLLACYPACPQTPSEAVPPMPQADLTQVSIENLMNLEVTSASKKEQKMSQVAAAIFFVTQEDIRRS